MMGKMTILLRHGLLPGFPPLSRRCYQQHHSRFYYNLLCRRRRSQPCCYCPREYNLHGRNFSRSSFQGVSTPDDKAIAFVVSIGHERNVAEGVVKALKSSGISGESLLSMVRTMAGRWEVGEDAGLETLIASVREELARSEGKKEIKFWCVPSNAWDEETCVITNDDAKFSVTAFEGMSITDVAKFGSGENAPVLGEYLDCACSGIMACSTCQVVVDKKWFDIVGHPEEAEQDMLDLAYNPQESSRLGCQIVLGSTMDGLVLMLPKGSNNMMDNIPFDD
mmetsp:Transcript_21451/g.34605  ORF Transcript_21451/g.34605 Transcript_21451/m.34605 type:complete len:279 (+) Transcript_21451:125-961(+)